MGRGKKTKLEVDLCGQNQKGVGRSGGGDLLLGSRAFFSGAGKQWVVLAFFRTTKIVSSQKSIEILYTQAFIVRT